MLISRNRFNFEVRLLLTVALCTTLLAAKASYADNPDADLLRQGTDALKRGAYDTAIAKFSAAIRLVPGDAEAWSKRGEAYAAKGEYDRGILDCSEAIRLSPSSNEAYRRRGNAYSRAGDSRERSRITK
jgi:Flp pilus assembly protein TadD